MAEDRKRRTRVKIGVDVQSTGRSKGRGSTQIVPTVTIERERRRGDGGKEERKRRVSAEHLLDLRLGELTPAAKRMAAGDRVTVLGAGPRLVVLAPRGVLGLASREASEAIRTALAEAPGARLESVVRAVDRGGVSVSVTLLRAAGVGRHAASGGGRPVAKLAPEDAAAKVASGRQGR